MLVERIGSVQAWRTIVGLVQDIEGMGLVVRKKNNDLITCDWTILGLWILMVSKVVG